MAINIREGFFIVVALYFVFNGIFFMAEIFVHRFGSSTAFSINGYCALGKFVGGETISLPRPNKGLR